MCHEIFCCFGKRDVGKPLDQKPTDIGSKTQASSLMDKPLENGSKTAATIPRLQENAGPSSNNTQNQGNNVPKNKEKIPDAEKNIPSPNEGKVSIQTPNLQLGDRPGSEITSNQASSVGSKPVPQESIVPPKHTKENLPASASASISHKQEKATKEEKQKKGSDNEFWANAKTTKDEDKPLAKSLNETSPTAKVEKSVNSNGSKVLSRSKDPEEDIPEKVMLNKGPDKDEAGPSSRKTSPLPLIKQKPTPEEEKQEKGNDSQFRAQTKATGEDDTSNAPAKLNKCPGKDEAGSSSEKILPLPSLERKPTAKEEKPKKGTDTQFTGCISQVEQGPRQR